MNTQGKRIFFMFLMLVLVSFCGIAHAEILTALAVSAISAGAGAAIQGWFNWAGMKRQERENQRVETLGIARDDEAIARSEKWAQKDLALKKEQLGMQKTQMQRNYATETRNKLLQTLAMNSQMANNMISIWRGRRAA